ncbi:MAG: uroporphyrinogen-III synthase [Deltaproteobacteria bacterium]|nr:uroporphyrinogen-III synthase [Deltaproteobacteria bacterium]
MSLAGKRVLVTRAREQASVLARRLRDLGAVAVEVPVIRIVPSEDLSSLFAALVKEKRYDWVVFTSVNGVRFFFQEAASQHYDMRRLEQAKLAAIGPATATALSSRGVVAETIPSEYRGEAVAEAIIERSHGDLKGVSVLLFRAQGARPALPETLRRAGARVQIIEAYRAERPERDEAVRLRAMLEKRELDVVTFTSSSTVNNLIKILGDGAVGLLFGLTIASIGPITSETALKRGLRVDITASEYTIEGLVKALEDFFKG